MVCFFVKAHLNGLTTCYYSFLFTTLDLSILKSDKYSANITAFQLFEPNNTNVNEIFKAINLKKTKTNSIYYKPSIVTLLSDLVSLLSRTIIESNLIDAIQFSRSVSCETETPWALGQKFKKCLKENNFYGYTGRIQFNDDGERTNVTFTIVERITNTFNKVIF